MIPMISYLQHLEVLKNATSGQFSIFEGRIWFVGEFGFKMFHDSYAVSRKYDSDRFDVDMVDFNCQEVNFICAGTCVREQQNLRIQVFIWAFEFTLMISLQWSPCFCWLMQINLVIPTFNIHSVWRIDQTLADRIWNFGSLQNSKGKMELCLLVP